MVTYGDGVSDIDVSGLVKFHKKQKTIGTITGIHPKFKFGIVKTDSNNLVTKFDEKPVLNSLVNGGYMVFDSRVFKYLQKGETEHPALKRLAKEKQLSVYKHMGFWYGIDTHKEFKELNSIWETKNPPWKIWK